MDDTHAPVLVLGSGAAGCTAAIYAARANLRPLVVQGMQPGGQMTITTDVENFPGFADVIQGPWLMEQMAAQARNVGAVFADDLVTAADLSRRPFTCHTDSGARLTADALIVATGASARWLGLEAETRYRGAGVSACATCDGFFFRGKEVLVVGGGNTAVEEALFLTRFATTVTLVHRRDRLRAEKIMQDRLLRHPKIAVVWDSVVRDITGANGTVSGVVLENRVSGAIRELAVQGVFIAIGHDPNTSLFRGKLAMDDEGYLRTAPDSTITSVPGVFAAGDVRDRKFRQAITAAGMGCMAAIEAGAFLAETRD